MPNTTSRRPVIEDRPLSPIPGHINDVTRMFCNTEGQMAPGGQCPKGCNHADHYSNDGHPECEERLTLAELVRLAR